MHNNDNKFVQLERTKCRFWFVDLANQSNNAFNEIFAIEIFIANMLLSENRSEFQVSLCQVGGKCCNENFLSKKCFSHVLS
jgi:hypothetical protein